MRRANSVDYFLYINLYRVTIDDYWPISGRLLGELDEFYEQVC